MAKDEAKRRRQMKQRGWTDAQIAEAVANGAQFIAANLETGGAAMRYVHPVTGRSVVIDDASGEVIHVGGDGFTY